MGYRNDIAALQEKLNLVRTERDALRGELELLREERDETDAVIQREAYLREELNKLRAMPERLANSEIRARQLEARIRELRDAAATEPAHDEASRQMSPVRREEQSVWILTVLVTVGALAMLKLLGAILG